MSKKTPVIDLSALEQAGTEHEQHEALQRLERHQVYSRSRRREDSAWKLLGIITPMSQAGGECRDANIPLDAVPFAAPLVEAFFEVCDVMREQQLGSELATLDEDQMVGVYGKDRHPPLARIGYQIAVKTLAEGIARGKEPSLQKQLTETVKTFAGRCVWYMMYPIVEGLLTSQGRLFRKTEAPSSLNAHDSKRRPMYKRDHLWLEWNERGVMKPAAIRDRWNSEYKQHGGAKIAPGRAGYYVVKEGLRKARTEQRPTG